MHQDVATLSAFMEEANRNVLNEGTYGTKEKSRKRYLGQCAQEVSLGLHRALSERAQKHVRVKVTKQQHAPGETMNYIRMQMNFM